MKIQHLVLAAAMIAMPATLFAQTTPAERHDIAGRKVTQQERIGQGVRSGQLTARETGHVEHQEAGINREEHGMRAQDNGHLTSQDRHTLARQQNRESHRIYRDKHNSRVR
jgi:hypothetical protein